MIEIFMYNARMYEVGDIILISSIDIRQWRKLWFFITFRSPPMIKEYKKIRKINNNTLILDA